MKKGSDDILPNGTSRTKSFARNAVVSISSQVLIIILGFVTRSVFVSQLGVALLGVNTLLTNAVAMLAIADLGINGALMFALYKPLQKNDWEKAASIIQFAARIFRWVALIVAIFGLLASPFIKHLIRLETEISGLTTYYLILLSSVVASYLMLSRTILVEADQKIYLVKLISMGFNILKSICQIIVLVCFQSFLLFLVIQVIFTFAVNAVVFIKVGKLYPFIREPARALEKTEKKAIMSSVQSLLIFRVAGLILSNSTGILISVLIGTMALGYYSNYLLIVTSISMITEVIFSASTPSIGNLIAEEDSKTSRKVFDEIVLLSILLHGVAAIFLFVLIDDFIELWLGSEFVVESGLSAAIALSFYITGVLMPLWSFRNATGLFHKTQWVMVLTVLISIPLAVFLSGLIGTVGIVLAPAIARLITGGWVEPWLLMRGYLSGKLRNYFFLQFGSVMVWSAIAASVSAVEDLIELNIIAGIAVKILLVLIAVTAVVYFFFRPLKSFKSLAIRILNNVGQKRIREMRDNG